MIQKSGSTERLVDGAGIIVTAWRVDYLQPSSDVVPWPVHAKNCEPVGRRDA
ncbi:DUF1942 domain-containing protein [Mycobacterium sp. DL99]|uniref:DUF1942 domain-containing protein n=1 Tax=Mycobacterium sp. DL99 TaxID=2528957 RepID=UPI001436888D|nr:DUF1942 domain-containing protein [Mycobacterium sp. DL99]